MDKLPEIVIITWKDVASANTGLMDVQDLMHYPPPKAKIVGFLVKETAEAYYVAKEIWEHDQFKYVHVIPKDTAIIDIERINNYQGF
jgi:hypothetical protein